MGHQESGDSSAFPASFTVPDDGDVQDASSVNVGFEALADRTAYLRTRLGQIAALTFHTDVDTGAATFGVVKYSDATQKWHALGDTVNDYFESTQKILEWPGTSEIPAPQLTANVAWDFDIDAAGNAVLVDQLEDNTRSRTAAGAWTLNVGTGAVTIAPCILYEPVSGNWVLASQVGAEIKVRTSTNLFASYTDRTEPTFNVLGIVTGMAHNGAGRIVMQSIQGTNVQFSYSDDGGVTWSAPSTHALGFTYAIAAGVRFPRPVFVGSKWVAVGVNNTTGVTRVFNSADGITWTAVADLASVALSHIAGIGGIVVGLTTSTTSALSGGIVVSQDDGATWRKCEGTFVFSATHPRDVAVTDSRFIILASGRIFPGIGFGEGGDAVT